ncbi:hypothetical protein [Boudabousia marimammalium]|uniref:DUF3153 domain-containing protein n=1 Tax=Boudabousia marimammalium TaxID=156892 RepID=A0A1Q5PKI2_9ACTO|nr:hypothetical protein [Boudabousia marimammalium]OKL46719.1 hypothetical protein BM477_07145 [Boudabousia marimammalium]
MRIKSFLRAAGAALLCLGLSGCVIQSDIEISSDLLVDGKISAEIPRPLLAGKENSPLSGSCKNFSQNFNAQQKANQMMPNARLALEVVEDKSNDQTLICDFQFRQWDPNLNSRVLWAAGDGYVFDLTRPVNDLFGQAGNDTKISIRLTFPKPITKAEGGNISGNTVTYDSLEKLREAHQIVAGDIENKGLWEQYSLFFILLAAIPAGAVVILGIRKGKLETPEDQ